MRNYLDFRNINVVISNRLVIVEKKRYELPRGVKFDKVVVKGTKIYIDGYELKKDGFKKTLKAKILTM